MATETSPSPEHQPPSPLKTYLSSTGTCAIIGLVIALLVTINDPSTIGVVVGTVLGALVGFLAAWAVNRHHRIKYNL